MAAPLSHWREYFRLLETRGAEGGRGVVSVIRAY